MLMIYVPALAVGTVGLLIAPAVNGREALTAGLVAIHFLKRCIEVLCVHSYSGKVSGGVSGGIGTFYALLSALIISQQQTVAPALYSGLAADTLISAGLVLFGIGQAGNLYHHMLLAKLRSSADQSGGRVYKLPTGGLFGLVTMPHYFFEVLAWTGIGLCTQQVNALLVATGMASYLSGRAKATTTWYRNKFGETAVPPERKHLVPFLF